MSDAEKQEQPTEENTKDGVYNPSRYTITHKDGKPIDPDKKYLVIELSPEPDLREFNAATEFIRVALITGYPDLSESLQKVLDGKTRVKD